LKVRIHFNSNAFSVFQVPHHGSKKIGTRLPIHTNLYLASMLFLVVLEGKSIPVLAS